MCVRVWQVSLPSWGRGLVESLCRNGWMCNTVSSWNHLLACYFDAKEGTEWFLEYSICHQSWLDGCTGFWGRKMSLLGFQLKCVCIMEMALPAVRCSLGHLAFFGWNWGEANMHVKCLCEAVISASTVQSLQMASLAAETTDGEILVAFWQKMASEAILDKNIKM